MHTIPAASPSRPSMKLTALMVTTTTRMVSTVPWFGSRISVSPPGSGTQFSSAPLQTRIAPAATCPASLLTGPSPHRSSTTPTATMSPPATSPPYMARPPSSGIGTTWTSRSRAACIAFAAIAPLRTSGVSRYVTAAVISRRALRALSHCSPPAKPARSSAGPPGVPSPFRDRSDPGRAGPGGPRSAGGRQRGDLAQPADGDRSGAQQPGHITGQVDDRGRHVVLALAIVQVDRHRLAKLLLRAGGGGRGRRPGQVRAADRERTGLLEQVQGQGVQRHPDRDRPVGVAEIPVQAAVGRAHQGERPRPELIDQVLAVGAEVLHQRHRRAHGADQHRWRGLPASALRRQQRRHGHPVEGIRRYSVDRIRGQHDQLAGAQREGRGGQAVPSLAGVGTVIRSAHRWIIPSACLSSYCHRRDEPVPADRQRRSSAKIQYTAGPCCSPCSTATAPPPRSSRRAERSTVRTASSPSSPPPHRAVAGSYSPTSGGTQEPAGMYGGLLITRSTAPSRAESAVAKSPSCSRTRPAVCGAATATRPMLRAAHRRASGSASTACTRAPGTSWAIASAIAPDPVPRSATTGSATSIAASVSIAQPVMTSVSGRGTKTPGPTSSSR